MKQNTLRFYTPSRTRIQRKLAHHAHYPQGFKPLRTLNALTFQTGAYSKPHVGLTSWALNRGNPFYTPFLDAWPSAQRPPGRVKTLIYVKAKHQDRTSGLRSNPTRKPKPPFTPKGPMSKRQRTEPEKKTGREKVDFDTMPFIRDPVYNSALVGMFASRVMKHGKKQKAYKLTYTVLERLRQRTSQNPIFVLEKAVQNVMPLFEVKPRRVGGSTYQVPYDVENQRGTVLAVQWLLSVIRKRGGVSTYRSMEDELFNAFKGSGLAIKRRDDEHRSAASNAAFERYRVGKKMQRGRPGSTPTPDKGQDAVRKTSSGANTKSDFSVLRSRAKRRTQGRQR